MTTVGDPRITYSQNYCFTNSSLLWDVFIINCVEQLQTLPKIQSEIDISPFIKAQKTLL